MFRTDSDTVRSCHGKDHFVKITTVAANEFSVQSLAGRKRPVKRKKKTRKPSSIFKEREIPHENSTVFLF